MKLTDLYDALARLDPEKPSAYFSIELVVTHHSDGELTLRYALYHEGKSAHGSTPETALEALIQLRSKPVTRATLVDLDAHEFPRRAPAPMQEVVDALVDGATEGLAEAIGKTSDEKGNPDE